MHYLFCIVSKSLHHLHSYTVIEPPDGAFGALSNGNWSGIVKLVKDRVQNNLLII